MALVRSRQLWGPTVLNNTGLSTLLYTVPAARTAVVRSSLVENTHTSTYEVRLAMTPAGGGAEVEFWRGIVPASGVLELPYFVADPGALIRCTEIVPAIPGGTRRCTGWGSLLVGAPA